MGHQRFAIVADAFALSTTAKTAFMVIAGSGVSFCIVEFSVSVDQGSGRFQVDLFESTETTGGTKTSTGAKQTGGYTSGTDGTPGCTYGRKYSAEGTTYTSLKLYGWVPCPGPFVIQFPLGREPESLLSGSTNHKALGVRVKVDTGTPNMDGFLEWEE